MMVYISSNYSQYQYDYQGNRSRKVVYKNNIREERYYVGNFEVYRHYVNNSLDYERTSNNISDGDKVFARVDVKDSVETLIRYQYNNHLGSACLELDEIGAIISYEEYHPFGSTSYKAGRSPIEVSQKRYRYVGKERDEETGLYYYGARYYASWLCRFISVDPLNEKYPELSAYQYASNRPISGIDLDGLEFKSAIKNVSNAFGIPFDDLSGITNKRVHQFANMQGKPEKLNCFQSCLYIWSTTDNPYVTEYLKELDNKIYKDNNYTANMSSPHPTVAEFKNNPDKYHYFISPKDINLVEPGDMIALNPIIGIWGHYAIVMESPSIVGNNMEIKLGTTLANDGLFGEKTYQFKFENNRWVRGYLYLEGFLRVEENIITIERHQREEVPPKMSINKDLTIKYEQEELQLEYRDEKLLIPLPIENRKNRNKN
jgi:RHS repeat-associated protein